MRRAGSEIKKKKCGTQKVKYYWERENKKEREEKGTWIERNRLKILNIVPICLIRANSQAFFVMTENCNK